VSGSSKYVGKVFRLKKAFGPLASGSQVYCFAHNKDILWFELPIEWAGVNQINLKEEVFLELI